MEKWVLEKTMKPSDLVNILADQSEKITELGKRFDEQIDYNNETVDIYLFIDVMKHLNELLDITQQVLDQNIYLEKQVIGYKNSQLLFWAMPTRKTKIGNALYYRLEIGDVILPEDVVEFRAFPEMHRQWAWETLSGTKYNPISKHKGLIIWRKEND